MLSVIPAPKKAKELGGVFVLPARLKVKSDFDQIGRASCRERV